jgi:putative Holliday junction resolvase
MTQLVNLLGLDIGERRIGVARVNLVAKLPEALVTLPNNASFLEQLKQLIKQHQIDGLVVGLPRNLSGEETAQSQTIRDFCTQNLTVLQLPIIWQDETLSSVAAEADAKGNKSKIGLDALAAKVILEDYLSSNEDKK